MLKYDNQKKKKFNKTTEKYTCERIIYPGGTIKVFSLSSFFSSNVAFEFSTFINASRKAAIIALAKNQSYFGGFHSCIYLYKFLHIPDGNFPLMSVDHHFVYFLIFWSNFLLFPLVCPDFF